MSNEELELVTDFGSLKAGDVIVIKPCLVCGRPHRKMLIRLCAPQPVAGCGLDIEMLPNWDVLPLEACAKGHVIQCITERGVRARRLYRVLIPPVADASTETTTLPRETKRAKERAR